LRDIIEVQKESIMSKSKLMHTLLAACFITATGGALAADNGETVFGSQLMTQQERNEHRLKMQSAKTAEERETVRSQHHQQMLERARQQGVTLPETPPDRGTGRGMGPGGGQGMGGGAGMGGGGGR
jgi:activator of 2-hydroxyglutaryl-CoA dehydratase